MEPKVIATPLPVRTAIFPVAGLGTRFLPATKATPKELLPVLDRPLIQFAIDEARAAGIERMIFVSHPSKGAIEKYVTHDAVLHEQLCAKGKHDVADRLVENALDTDKIDVRFVMQDEPLGLGHAVLCAAEDALPGPVAVVLPDDLILGEIGCLSEMIEAYAQGGAGHMVATMQVDPDAVKSYGILSVTGRDDKVLWADGMVEKPAPADAPSRQAVVGRYVLDGSIFDDLRDQEPGAGGEIQLTDAISRATPRIGLSGYRFSGQRYDCGSKEGMLRAILAYANMTPEFRDVISEHKISLLAAE
ncbi:UTP--glucose-1-phosphate uridylyltransferase [Puniceibacterium sediminis]|uniref:UTP--glucose-1-phosphate uridylyltransferase n=1 Tax=Puniceibacterium sediminis TaxID=1608407 RepID=A0A238X241_9RHOB|nr:UTP--glucose-1-phosphate uridylyltransferase [Puniceibacterium sediminis]SNR52504.1 UTP--glucose-1-phosphate uridylyltransferase [Puniceibacterium sediminis]